MRNAGLAAVVLALLVLLYLEARSQRSIPSVVAAPAAASSQAAGATRPAAARPAPLSDPAPGPEARRDDNPLREVLAAELESAQAEREALVAALERSGPAAGAWVSGAKQRVDEVTAFVVGQNLGRAQSLGCYRAGCRVAVSFTGPAQAQDLERLADPARRGAWPAGVVITEPVEMPDGSLVAQLFLVAPRE